MTILVQIQEMDKDVRDADLEQDPSVVITLFICYACS